MFHQLEIFLRFFSLSFLRNAHIRRYCKVGIVLSLHTHYIEQKHKMVSYRIAAAALLSMGAANA
jgi:hypothetical protein